MARRVVLPPKPEWPKVAAPEYVPVPYGVDRPEDRPAVKLGTAVPAKPAAKSVVAPEPSDVEPELPTFWVVEREAGDVFVAHTIVWNAHDLVVTVQALKRFGKQVRFHAFLRGDVQPALVTPGR